uniref:CCHC-type domain-containing protein n=1 Tax=Cannabis sativa TaxID=3483 RepID=A0A803QER0_CANSA
MEGNEDRRATVNESLPPQNETLAETFVADEPLAEVDGVQEEQTVEGGQGGITGQEVESMRQQFLDSMTLELEADLELNEEVTSKGVLAKLFGRRNLSRGRVKEILAGIWTLKGRWRMKTMQTGVWGIFFDEEEDKQMILTRRPWLVSGVLLNIRDWPADGDWAKTNMEVARFWVEAHGLPTPYLTWENTDVIARKVGQYIDFDRAPRLTIARRGFLKFLVDLRVDQRFVAGFYLNISRDRKEWVQFKYHKLPALCFNCGYLAHSYNKCNRPKEYAYPPVGRAVPMYGAWLKVGVPIRNCFDPSIPRLIINRPAKESAPSGKPEKDKGKRVITIDENDASKGSDKSAGKRTVGEGCRQMAANSSIGKSQKVQSGAKPGSAGKSPVLAKEGSRVDIQKSIKAFPHPMAHINNKEKDKGIIISLMPDIGPTSDQMVDIPHVDICKSRTPHHFPEPTVVDWPSNTSLPEVVQGLVESA